MAIIKEIKSANAVDKFDEGDIVLHPEFGRGKIEKIMGSGDFTKAIIKFEVEGQKKLMLKFAKLTKPVKEEPKSEAQAEPTEEGKGE